MAYDITELRPMKTAKKPLKKKAHIYYHKKVDPQTPDQSQPIVTVLSSSNWQKMIKSKYIFILLSLVFALTAAFLLYRQFPNLGKKTVQPVNQSKNVIVLKEGVLSAPNDKQKGPFTCPSTSPFCKSGQDVSIGSSYIGMGSKLANASPVYAAFDGYFEATNAAIANPTPKAKAQNIIIGILTDKTNLLRAHYYFIGPLPKNKNVNVKAGDIIAYSGQVMPLYQNNTLVFVLTRNDKVMEQRLGGERVKLSSQDFKSQ